ncbi:hypothetical protein [Butyrivibrio sp. VCD2006]|jgi:hypothetical protein|uniref:hypothetical protein n=1 Tax=Butyrivibrio sp. VCD2006 TaxID=1280664 RepID=UPI0004068F4D|nr:hypothetical protein [Butyrivibrio sp. VCD2006]
MGRTRAYRRDVRNRAIAHKKRIWKDIWKDEYFIPDGKFAKAHMGCGCYLCKPWKHCKELSDAQLRELDHVKQAMDDYYNS